MVKLLGYKKKAIAIFTKVKHLVQRLQVTVTGHKMISNSIMLVVALDSLHDDLKIITTPFFYLGNKDLQEIQLSVIFTETANLAKQVTDITRNLPIIAMKKVLQW